MNNVGKKVPAIDAYFINDGHLTTFGSYIQPMLHSSM